MGSSGINRRSFIRNISMASAAFALTENPSFGILKNTQSGNPFPRWKGFNLLDYFSAGPDPKKDPYKTTEDDFRWMSGWGFDFVRIPMAYPRYLSLDPSRKIVAEDFYKFDTRVIDEVERLVSLANAYGLHVSLNMHRAPGYCINAGFYEPYNLWKDSEAQDAFVAHWRMWAERFRSLAADKISFDLLNEPASREDMNDQYSKNSAVPGDIYRKMVNDVTEAIRAVSPHRIILADGNNVGNDVVPELVDLGIGQSCRGYFPHYISHYQAHWVWKDPSEAPRPVWPGTIAGREFNRQSLEAYYHPWKDLISQGVGVHCGECGCWKKTPHEVFLAWFEDVIDILTGSGIGYALWNFRGDFGILDSDRADAEYTDWYGHKLDRKLLELLKKY
jgi:endoglucanase